MTNRLQRVTRIIQFMWLAIAAICVVESGRQFTSDNHDGYTGYMLGAIALFAIFRFVTLRRKQLKDDQKI